MESDRFPRSVKRALGALVIVLLLTSTGVAVAHVGRSPAAAPIPDPPQERCHDTPQDVIAALPSMAIERWADLAGAWIYGTETEFVTTFENQADIPSRSKRYDIASWTAMIDDDGTGKPLALRTTKNYAQRTWETDVWSSGDIGSARDIPAATVRAVGPRIEVRWPRELVGTAGRSLRFLASFSAVEPGKGDGVDAILDSLSRRLFDPCPQKHLSKAEQERAVAVGFGGEWNDEVVQYTSLSPAHQEPRTLLPPAAFPTSPAQQAPQTLLSSTTLPTLAPRCATKPDELPDRLQPEDAARCLIEAWRANNRDAASLFAEPQGVGAMFAAPADPSGDYLSEESCSDAGRNASDTANLFKCEFYGSQELLLTVEGTPSAGYAVIDVKR